MFSPEEDDALQGCINTWKAKKCLTDDDILEIIFAVGEGHSDFWAELVPMRLVRSVYDHIHQKYHPLGHQGKWTKVQDEDLKKTVAALGRWTQEEEEQLTRIVNELTEDPSNVNKVKWVLVSKQMGTCTRQQCQNKWLDCLKVASRNSGHKAIWSEANNYTLYTKVVSVSASNEKEIKWSTFSDDKWNIWNAHILQTKWAALKKRVLDYQSLSHSEVVHRLASLVKKSDSATLRLGPPANWSSTNFDRGAAVGGSEGPDGATAGA
ncbi:hypothetical protein EWM64_g3813 [Hericium alpestre]|uniref:Myb-like domain-containing protein n=1 Tax=Hericium alpestre TaxID=135208 RepID=A0A4Z0A3C7_9AGAM|nr:hypothetical protein EWM64_g3813 [Hericium alpestre]